MFWSHQDLDSTARFARWWPPATLRAETPAPADITSIALALATGAAYLGFVWFGPELLSLLGLPFFASDEFLRRHGERHILLVSALRLPALLCLLGGLCWRGSQSLRAAFGRESVPLVGIVALASLVASVTLDRAGIWPWIWRWPDAPGRAYGEVLWEARNWLAIAIYAAVWAGINPLIEEAAVRFGLLHLLLRATSRPRVAAVGSGILFSAMHFPDGVSLGSIESLHAGWLAVFGAALGVGALQRRGVLWVPIAAHVVRNLVEFVLMISSYKEV